MEEHGTDLGINRANLTQELENIPNDILVWTRRAAEAQENVYRAETKVKLCEAKLSISVRQNPVDYGFPKVTEELVKSIVSIQPEYITANSELVEAKRVLQECRAVVDALDAKRSSLKYLAELTVGGYLGSTPVNPRTPVGVVQ